MHSGDEVMDNDEFDTVVHEALDRLPGWVRDALDNIEVLVVDEPDDEDVPDGGDLLGLYVGTPLTERDSAYSGELPDVVYVFRKPHLALDLPVDELRQEIAKTLIHEIAHHFGIDDDHLDEIGWG